MTKISELSFPIKIVMLVGAIYLMALTQINKLFWYMQIMDHPVSIFSAELFASILFAAAMFAGLKVNLKTSPFQKKWLITFAIGFVAIVALYFLSKRTGTLLLQSTDASIWRPYFIMENFLFVPIFEELILREFFLKLFPAKRAWQYILSASLTAAAFSFALSDYDLPALIFVFAAALVFSGLRWYSNDIKLPIVLHILLNLGSYFL